MNKDIIQVFADIENFNLPKDVDFITKIDENVILETGKRIYWYHERDLEYFGDIGERPEDCLSDLFTGICMPIPDVDGNRELDINNIIVVIDSYPTEKESPTTVWVSLNRLLDTEGLAKIFSIEGK